MTLDRFRLDDRVCVVTGGSRGLGREMVRAFAAVGAHVVIASRKQANCDDLAAEIEATTDRRALAVGCHVGDWDQCDALVARTLDEFGRIDVLVNNAGMSPLYESLDGVTEALWDKVIDVNLKGPFRLSALAATHMAENGGGSIVNVSSIASVRPDAGTVPYAAAKAGLNAMTKGFAQAFGPSVRVNAIMAGPFLTDISKAWDLEAAEATFARELALGRAGRPEEIVGTALYLASDASTYTTGAVLPVEGGHP